MSHYPASKTCDICRHWDNDGMSPYGVCRKMPPTGSGWPRVSRKDWCGEWDEVLMVGPVPEAQGDVEKRRPGRPRKVES